MALGQHEQARVALKTALSLEPRKVEICLAMAGIQKELGDTKDAMTLYKKVLFDDPQNYGALIGQAEIYFDRKQWETVLINTGAVLEQFPNDLRAGQLHSRSLELGRIEDMLETASIWLFLHQMTSTFLSRFATPTISRKIIHPAFLLQTMRWPLTQR